MSFPGSGWRLLVSIAQAKGEYAKEGEAAKNGGLSPSLGIFADALVKGIPSSMATHFIHKYIIAEEEALCQEKNLRGAANHPGRKIISRYSVNSYSYQLF